MSESRPLILICKITDPDRLKSILETNGYEVENVYGAILNDIWNVTKIKASNFEKAAQLITDGMPQRK